MRGSVISAVLVVTGIAAPGLCQTNDHFYRSAQWRESVIGADAAGLAGAFVALPDRAGIVALNPAGLASLTRIELFASGTQSNAGNGIHEDLFASRQSLGLVGGGGLLTDHFAIGGFISQPSSVETTLADHAPIAGTTDSGYLRHTVTDVGAAAAWKVSQRLHLGAQVVASHLFLEGEVRRHAGTSATLLVGTSAGHTLVSIGMGGLYTVTEDLTLGLAGFAGASWKANRTAVDPAADRNLDEGSEYEVRRPSTLSGGASYRVSRRLLLVGQVDYVRYQEIQAALTIRQGVANADDYELKSAIEPRVGGEFAFAPSNSLSVVLRAGVRQVAGGALRYSGPNSLEGAAFVGAESETRVSGGTSLVMRTFRVDAAVETGPETLTGWVGVGTRF